MAEPRQQPIDLKPERIDTYREWQAAQKIPVVKGFFVEDVNKVELAPWDLKGRALFVRGARRHRRCQRRLYLRDPAAEQNKTAETSVPRDGYVTQGC